MKFKKGDRVIIKDGRGISNYTGGWNPSMAAYVGKVYTIKNSEKRPFGHIGYRMEEISFVWDEQGLEKKDNECIVIYRKGNETIALDKTTGKKAVAKCSPEDEYDFMTGAKLAFERLTEPEFKPYLKWRRNNYGYIGEPTPLKDAIGRELEVGDTVELYNSKNKYKGECVVCKPIGEDKAFVWGIAWDCKKDGTITGGWKIILKRKHKGVAHGEVVDDIKYVKERAQHE